MNSLLNHMLMLRIIRIQDLYRLPPALTLARVTHLERCRSKQHREGKPLGVDSCLDQLLRSGQVWVSPHESQRGANTGDPTGRDDGVSVLFTPILEALEGRLILADCVEIGRGSIPILTGRVACCLVVARGAIGGNDCGEGAGGGYEEGLHGECKLAKGVEACISSEDCCSALNVSQLV